MSSTWINPNADLSSQSKICPNCGQDNDRYGLPIYPFNDRHSTWYYYCWWRTSAGR